LDLSSLFRPTTIRDEQQIIDFLTSTFSLSREEPFVQPPLLRWKYWDARDDTTAPRSVVIERDGHIVAHAGLWPVTIHTAEKTESGIHMIDWAADPKVPGAGVALLQRLTKSYDFVYAIGGSDMTRSILPKFGFRIAAQTLTWARPLRPWQQMLRHQSRDFRLPVRFARNVFWSRIPPRFNLSGWTVRDLDSDNETRAGIFAMAKERDESFFKYLQRCPVSRCLIYSIVKDRRSAGFFVLSILRDQTRMAGVWLQDATPDFWSIALQLAQDVARERTTTSEFVVRCSLESVGIAAAQTGMRLRDQTPVFLFRKNNEGEPLPLQYQFCDNDAFFLEGLSPSFLT